jgi:hypothetical protein
LEYGSRNDTSERNISWHQASRLGNPPLTPPAAE